MAPTAHETTKSMNITTKLTASKLHVVINTADVPRHLTLKFETVVRSVSIGAIVETNRAAAIRVSPPRIPSEFCTMFIKKFSNARRLLIRLRRILMRL